MSAARALPLPARGGRGFEVKGARPWPWPWPSLVNRWLAGRFVCRMRLVPAMVGFGLFLVADTHDSSLVEIFSHVKDYCV